MTAQKVISIILGVLVLGSGIYLLCAPALGVDIVIIFAGIAMIVEGIGSICSWSNGKKMGVSNTWTLVGGIISIIIGCVVLFGYVAKFVFATILIYFLVAWLIVVGIIRICGAFKVRSFIKDNKIQNSPVSWGLMLVVGILMVIVGIFAFCNPIFIGWFIGIMVGISVISAGCGLIVAGIAA